MTSSTLRLVLFPSLPALPGFLALLLPAFAARAQVPLPVYTDYLVNGFQDWGWAPHDYANTSPAHSGTASVAVTMMAGWQGLQVYHPDIDSSRW